MHACVVSNILLSARVVGVDVNSQGNLDILANLLMSCTWRKFCANISADPVMLKGNFWNCWCWWYLCRYPGALIKADYRRLSSVSPPSISFKYCVHRSVKVIKNNIISYAQNDGNCKLHFRTSNFFFFFLREHAPDPPGETGLTTAFVVTVAFSIFSSCFKKNILKPLISLLSSSLWSSSLSSSSSSFRYHHRHRCY